MSISLNGNSANYLRIASALGFADPPGAITVAGWVKPANTNARKTAFATIDPNGYLPIQGFRLEDDGTLRPIHNGNVFVSAGAYSANTWYYVFAKRSADIFTPSGGAGVSGSGFDADGDFSTSTGTASDWGFVQFDIGIEGTSGYPWNGEICCVRVWNTELTLAELRAEALSATPVKTANLRANWRLATNTDLTSTVNGYTLTANGTVSTGSTEPTDIAGGPTAKPWLGHANQSIL